jgi:outer membrane protein assembly factor BamB
MNRPVAVLSLLLSAAAPAAAGDGPEAYWPQWRGPLLTGVAPGATPPTRWSETHNVAWKLEIPGKGSATPVVWGDHVYVVTSVPTEVRREPPAAPDRPEGAGRRRGPRGIEPEYVQQFALLAVRRADGAVAWRRVLREELPHEGTHPTGTWASSSAATDGERVYAFFGSRGLYALDMAGELLWEKDLGDMTIKLGFGEGSSPALHAGRLVVNWDHEGDSFIVALDAETGGELWRRSRDEGTSWATPLIVERDGKAQVVSSATGKVRSYDLENGEVLWEVSGMTANVIPTPVHSGGLVYLTSGFRGSALLAVRLAEASGDITGGPAIAWSYDRDTPYVPSPLLYDGQLYLLKSNDGILSAFDAATGERHYGVRLEGVANVYASPLGAAGRIYVAGREGAVAVVRSGPEFELLAVNQLEDAFDASPVAVEGELYLRGKHLYRISEN